MSDNSYSALRIRLEDEREELKDHSRLLTERSALDPITAQRIANTMWEASEALGAQHKRACRAESKFGKALGAIRELVALKDAKDAGFKTYVEEEAYKAAKVKAWERARNALGLAGPERTESKDGK